MAKKKKHPEHENLERWLVSYADFITLLFATFTCLYALSLTDVNKLKSVAEAISQGFEQQSLLHGIQTVLQGKTNADHNSPLNNGSANGVLDKYRSMTYSPGQIEAAKSLAADLKSINQAIQTQNDVNALVPDAHAAGAEDKNVPLNPVQMSVQGRGIRISFDSRLLFGPGSAGVKPSAYKALDAVAARLKKMDGNMIHVEGHTDNLPIATAQFPSNWELSSARAGSIVRYLIGQGCNSSSLVAVGYGSSQPVAGNDTAEGRSKNRRVDIVVYNEKASAMVNPRLQALSEQSVPVLEAKEVKPDIPKIVEPVLPTNPKEGPVKVIIKDKDGSERILIPKFGKPTFQPMVKPVATSSAPAGPKPAEKSTH